MTDRGAFTFHAGSAERPARVRLYGVRALPAEGAFARIGLRDPLVLDVDDRFVLRESGRGETVAGGVVLDPHPPRRPGPAGVERLEARARAGRGDLPSLVIGEGGAVSNADLETLAGLSPDDIPGARRVGSWWVAEALYGGIAARVQERLEAFHAAEPLAAGEDVTAIRAAVGASLERAHAAADPELADTLIESLTTEGLLAREGALVRLASHALAGAGDEGARLIDAVRDGEPTPPTVPELAAAGFPRAVIDAVVRSGALVRISPDLVLTAAFVERAAEVVRSEAERGITISAFRERLGTSRKYAVPLMEHLDRIGVTRRVGDLRFARVSTSGPPP